jgi:glycerol uptake facilitator-like aquaporin
MARRRNAAKLPLLAVAMTLVLALLQGASGLEPDQEHQHAQAAPATDAVASAPNTADALAAAVASLAAADPSGAVRAALLRELGQEEPPHARRQLLAAATAPPAAPAPPLWRPPKYSLSHRALSEFIGMALTIFVGESMLANELLPSTKGHGCGWLAVVLTFGLAFFVFIQAFGGISAKFNPSMCLANWITGSLTGVEFLVLSLAEIAGSFLGAVCVWVLYLPHFKSLPEPPSLAPEDELLRRRDVMQQNALQIASYNTRPDRTVGWGAAAAARNAAEKAAVEKQGAKGGSAGGTGAIVTTPLAPPTTPTVARRATAAAGAAAIMGALDNFVYYLKPGVHPPRLEDELAAVGSPLAGGHGNGYDRDPWRDEEAAAAGATGGGAGLVPVSAHELADRYFQHDDQVERRRRENSNEAIAAMEGARARSASPAGATSAGGPLPATSSAPHPVGTAPASSALPPLPPPKDLSRRTVQVADLQRHLADLHVAEVRRRVALARGGTMPPRPLPPPSQQPSSQHQGRPPPHQQQQQREDSAGATKTASPGAPAAKSTGFSLLPRLRASSASALAPSTSAAAADGSGDGSSHHHHHHHHSHSHSHSHVPHLPRLDSALNRPPLDPAREAYARECAAAWALLSEEERRAHRLYAAAMEADRNAKLSIFSTRPAIMSPVWNLIAEAMGTFMLILGALLIELVPDVFLPPELRPLYTRGLQAMLIGWMVVVFIAALGGPTGYAANPARDFGPRLAHFLLPICNKGSSEWREYAWVPVLGPLAGGAAAGGAYHALRAMFMAGVVE